MPDTEKPKKCFRQTIYNIIAADLSGLRTFGEDTA